ncbi:MAG TPA: hypothetical protein VMW84_01550 [Acidobacteriota bacterium]|nr:hypothetical protein [Acidobacteriota bacterium]
MGKYRTRFNVPDVKDRRNMLVVLTNIGYKPWMEEIGESWLVCVETNDETEQVEE